MAKGARRGSTYVHITYVHNTHKRTCGSSGRTRLRHPPTGATSRGQWQPLAGKGCHLRTSDGGHRWKGLKVRVFR
ncbi:hypothetical protein GW17_00053719 [Ensete ventricosum]|nr:hypothetical protein GW17_00053719 [Ensete ventricosum]